MRWHRGAVGVHLQEAFVDMGAYLDLDQWKRRAHFAFYRRFAQPHFSVTSEVDVTHLHAACAVPLGPSFFLATLFLSLQAANALEAFRLRLRGKRVWCHDVVDAGSTILLPDDTFTFARFRAATVFADFQAAGQQEIARRTATPELLADAGGDELIHYSVLPWIRFTSFTNALASPAESSPKIVFGRYVQEGARWRMPVSVQVHHALVDGIDVARFLEGFQARLDVFSPPDPSGA